MQWFKAGSHPNRHLVPSLGLSKGTINSEFLVSLLHEQANLPPHPIRGSYAVLGVLFLSRLLALQFTNRGTRSIMQLLFELGAWELTLFCIAWILFVWLFATEADDE